MLGICCFLQHWDLPDEIKINRDSTGVVGDSGAWPVASLSLDRIIMVRLPSGKTNLSKIRSMANSNWHAMHVGNSNRHQVASQMRAFSNAGVINGMASRGVVSKSVFTRTTNGCLSLSSGVTCGEGFEFGYWCYGIFIPKLWVVLEDFINDMPLNDFIRNVYLKDWRCFLNISIIFFKHDSLSFQTNQPLSFIHEFLAILNPETGCCAFFAAALVV